MSSLIGSTFLDQKGVITNGIDQILYVNNPSFRPDTGGGLAFWYRPTTVLSSAGGRNIMCLGGYASNANIQINIRRTFSLGGDVNSWIEVFPRATNGGAYTTYAAVTTPIIGGSLYHVVIEKFGTSYRIHINGVNQTINPWFSFGGGQASLWFGGITLGSPVFAVGGRISSAGTTYSDQRLNELIVYSGAWNDAEKLVLYNGGTPINPLKVVSPASIRSWWQLGDGRDSATTAYDVVGTNHLTLVNMSLANYVTP